MSVPSSAIGLANAVPARRNFRTIALIVASAMFMEQLDATILATALPTMARDFGVGAPSMSIALTSYLISLAVFIPVSGAVADRWGSRTVFRAAIGVFVAGSVLCALAPSLGFLVAARLLQGLGGAMMMPVGRLVLLRSVERRDLVSAMSWLLVPALIGPILGPPVGGFIVTYADWRWIFYINVPVGLVGMVLVSLFIDETRDERTGPFDSVGMILSGISLGSLLFGFETASRDGEGMLALALVAVGLVAGAAYLHHARRHAAPILDPALMRVPSFGTSVIAGSLTRITQGAQPFLLPLMMQLGFGLSAATSGLVTIATAIGSLMMKALAPRILRRFGFRQALVVNGILAALLYGTCAFFRPDWPLPAIFGVLVCCGFSMSFQFTAYNTVAYDRISPAQMSSATSFYTTFQQLMLSLGICVAALALHGSMGVQGHAAPELSDFSVAFAVVVAISLLATVWNLRFSADAGREISGHGRVAETVKRPAAETSEALEHGR
ncbi:DHA2 family efflux MFS transporter permease subunit [Aureimonas phyllosphaerae]|uniref:EmrB/QacA subfamily drug resistance transporter n=1 Tax=Aureimonas phyllosphaerae TaxID=1166078 RepID=A0A7W6BS07_9HYPH|nr:DHA2 family efflux MFS transporter permease subunit [Aureimonas phyllosphaerae]MBB3936994.1 EmrB/QacA subfamily drug resistance transporter [Aureimonas phyllosphaerae]MBB3960891.1 EmrB/QacA subfamily drug resistance transporter [Aureimonas phyllosphaerae]SFF51554.1 drug resistance transporter, EmrB/QacA subfamily [Aureimonas phyllosphaerae]